jgi:hypothetical protein
VSDLRHQRKNMKKYIVCPLAILLGLLSPTRLLAEPPTVLKEELPAGLTQKIVMIVCTPAEVPDQCQEKVNARLAELRGKEVLDRYWAPRMDDGLVFVYHYVDDISPTSPDKKKPGEKKP